MLLDIHPRHKSLIIILINCPSYCAIATGEEVPGTYSVLVDAESEPILIASMASPVENNTREI